MTTRSPLSNFLLHSSSIDSFLAVNACSNTTLPSLIDRTRQRKRTRREDRWIDFQFISRLSLSQMQRNTHTHRRAREDLFDLINMHKQHIFDMLVLSVRGGVNESLSTRARRRTTPPTTRMMMMTSINN